MCPPQLDLLRWIFQDLVDFGREVDRSLKFDERIGLVVEVESVVIQDGGISEADIPVPTIPVNVERLIINGNSGNHGKQLRNY